MNKTENILEFNKIKTLWADNAVTDAVKEQINMIEPYFDESMLISMQTQTTQAREMIEKCGTPPIPSMSGISELLKTADKEGRLSPEALESIGVMLVAVRRLKTYLNRCKDFAFSLAFYDENLDSCDDLIDQLQMQIRAGRVDDFASKLLSSIRKELGTLDTKMRDKVNQMIRSNKKYMSESFVVERNGHLCLPVKSEYRPKIDGKVMDKSSTGSTFFIEPTTVGKYFDDISLLKIEEENEVLRICYVLTAEILEKEQAILDNIRTIEKLDFAFSKGKLSIDYNGIEPNINTDRIIRLSKARHPLLNQTSCIPLDFKIGDNANGLIITGPNTGGKTVTIKTVGLLCLMAQCGLHVPCQEADICMNANIYCDIGDGQSLSDSLSTFSAHLKNILAIVDEVSEESLVLFDELGSGTDPAEGAGIAIAILKELKARNCLFLVTTHYPEVKQFGEDEDGIINARMDFDKDTLAPLYKLIIGQSGESCAFSIAKRLGMSKEMLTNAAIAAYGNNYKQHLPASDVESENTPDNTEKTYDASTKRPKAGHIITKKKGIKEDGNTRAKSFNVGDSVMIYPDRKIAIVCKKADDKGILRVQLPNKKIYINHKRVKLWVAADELYPDDYDFSIIFDSVANRKLRHQMNRKFTEGEISHEE